MARIIKITRKKIKNEKLYNFAVEEDQSYFCNGVAVHNCDSYILPILKGNLGNRKITKLQPSKSDLEKYIQFHDGKCCSGKVHLQEGDID